MNQNPTFTSPPITRKTDGLIRQVGFELEFSGISLEQTVTAVQQALGGKISIKNQAEQEIHIDDLGTFNIELDWEFLKRTASDYKEEEDMEVWIERLSQVAAVFVPIEVVCPPIPISEIDRLNPMTQALHRAGAVGTEESLIAAYGVHINPEIPSLDAETITAYLKAFALLQWWLVEAHDVDPTRKISPYIDLFSEKYIRHLIQQPQSEINKVIDDYLEFNPSRNRALDMLPMFAEIDESRVRSVINDPKIKSRPTFHYRLPNCHLDQPNWDLSEAWNHWVVVERLADQPQRLDELGAEFLSQAKPILGVERAAWVDYADQWLKHHALA